LHRKNGRLLLVNDVRLAIGLNGSGSFLKFNAAIIGEAVITWPAHSQKTRISDPRRTDLSSPLHDEWAILRDYVISAQMLCRLAEVENGDV
jgi:hypothetical protein